jgi:hypothetical protein
MRAAAAAVAARARDRYASSFSSGSMRRWLRDWTLTSWPSACLRSAPTVASSRGTCGNGSKEYQRMAFS